MYNQKQAIEKIYQIADENKLKFTTSPEVFFQTRSKTLFTGISANANSDKVTFRFAYASLKSSLIKEIAIYEYAKLCGLSFMPVIVNYEVTAEYVWLCYKYFEGSASGNVYQFLSKTNFNQIYSMLDDYDKIDVKKINYPGALSRDKESWHKLINLIIQKIPELNSDTSISLLLEYLLRANCPAPTQFTHGDLHPKNIIINGSELKIIDWESSHIDCFGFDLSFLYIRSYNEIFRNKIIDLVQNKSPENQYAFYFALCVNLLRDYFEWHLIADGKNELMSKDEVINNASISDIIVDLREQLQINFKMLKNI